MLSQTLLNRKKNKNGTVEEPAASQAGSALIRE